MKSFIATFLLLALPGNAFVASTGKMHRLCPSIEILTHTHVSRFHAASYLTHRALEEPEPPPLEQEQDGTTAQFRYNSLTIVYGLVAAILFAMPDRTMTQRLATKWGGAAGFGVAAAVSRLLSQSQSMDVATQQRLTVGLYGFSGLGLLALPGEAGFLPTAGSAMILTALLNAAKLWGVVVAFAGLGVVSRQNFLPESGSGLVRAVQGLRVTKEAKKRSLTYRNCLLLVLGGLVSCSLEGLFYVRYYGSAVSTSLFDISLQISAVARLFLLSSVIYCLKDLADRKQMTNGTTFIQLNLMVGSWAALVGLGQGCTMTGYSGKRMEMIALALPFLIKGFKYTKFRSDQKKNGFLERPPELQDQES